MSAPVYWLEYVGEGEHPHTSEAAANFDTADAARQSLMAYMTASGMVETPSTGNRTVAVNIIETIGKTHETVSTHVFEPEAK